MKEYKHNCGTCNLCMYANEKYICACDSTYFKYGEEIPEDFLDKKNECEDYDINFFEFCENLK